METSFTSSDIHTPQKTARAFDTQAGLVRLAAGERGLRAPGKTKEERAFNLIAERLDAERPPSSDTGASLLAPDLFQGHSAPTYVASMAISGLSRLRRQLGSPLADDIVRQTIKRLQAVVADTRIGRVGRSSIEFAFAAADDPTAEAELQRLSLALERRLDVDGQTFDLEVKIGFASRDLYGEHVADCSAEALIEAQTQGRKVHVYRETDGHRAMETSALLRDLKAAIANNSLSLVYQPKLHLGSQEIRSVEGLLRWRHPTRGPVSPEVFVPLAEETGLITDLTRWVVQRALADQARLADGGHATTVYVNLSGRLLPDAGFCAWILEVAQGRAPGALGLEITETAVIDDPERALTNLEMLAGAGLKIAIDDYGSGLSSLSYLKQMPAHELKIDKMFISSLTSSHRDPLLVRSTIEVAHALGMEVTAEGVETINVMALLRLMGCDHIQGYLIAKPLQLEALEDLLRDEDFAKSFSRQTSALLFSRATGN